MSIGMRYFDLTRRNKRGQQTSVLACGREESGRARALLSAGLDCSLTRNTTRARSDYVDVTNRPSRASSRHGGARRALQTVARNTRRRRALNFPERFCWIVDMIRMVGRSSTSSYFFLPFLYLSAGLRFFEMINYVEFSRNSKRFKYLSWR